MQCTQKAHHPVVAVVHQQQHPVFAPQPQRPERRRHALHLLCQLAVGECAVVVDQGRLARACSVEVDQVAREIEMLGRGGDGFAHGVSPRASGARMGVLVQRVNGVAVWARMSSAATLACTALRRW